MKPSYIYSNPYETVMKLRKQLLNFFIFIGERGTGKTYPILKGLLTDTLISYKPFIYLRTTNEELKTVANGTDNPFKVLNRDLDLNIQCKPIGGGKYGFFNCDEEGKAIQIICYCMCLSTVGKFRGSDYSDVNFIFWDEFINTTGTKNQFTNQTFNLLTNFYETVNRNRELNNEEPVTCIMAGNSNTLIDNVLMSLDLVDIIIKMKEDNEHYYYNYERGLYLELMENEEYRKAKSQTSLYRLTKGTQFEKMALYNEFAYDSLTGIINKDTKINYNEYVPLFSYDIYYFYKSKQLTNPILLVSKRKCKVSDTYDKENLIGVKNKYSILLLSYYINNLVRYADYSCKIAFHDLFKLDINK